MPMVRVSNGGTISPSSVIQGGVERTGSYTFTEAGTYLVIVNGGTFNGSYPSLSVTSTDATVTQLFNDGVFINRCGSGIAAYIVKANAGSSVIINASSSNYLTSQQSVIKLS